MARNRKATPEVEKVRPSLEGVAKHLVDRLYGPQGPAWGTRLTELEDIVLAVRQFLSEQMLEQALRCQAAQAAARHAFAAANCSSIASARANGVPLTAASA